MTDTGIDRNQNRNRNRFDGESDSSPHRIDSNRIRPVCADRQKKLTGSVSREVEETMNQNTTDTGIQSIGQVNQNMTYSGIDSIGQPDPATQMRWTRVKANIKVEVDRQLKQLKQLATFCKEHPEEENPSLLSHIPLLRLQLKTWMYLLSFDIRALEAFEEFKSSSHELLENVMETGEFKFQDNMNGGVMITGEQAVILIAKDMRFRIEHIETVIEWLQSEGNPWNAIDLA